VPQSALKDMQIKQEQQYLRNLISKLNVAVNAAYQESVWIDGFCNCLLHGHTSHDDDNTYEKGSEPRPYSEYKAGAEAAEEFLKCLSKSEEVILPASGPSTELPPIQSAF
jgi:hypothetical protein